MDLASQTCNMTTCNTIGADRSCRLQLVRLPSKPLDHRSSRKVKMTRLRMSEDPPLATAHVGLASCNLLFASEGCNWARGPMDKASAYGAWDCRFEACQGQ